MDQPVACFPRTSHLAHSLRDFHVEVHCHCLQHLSFELRSEAPREHSHLLLHPAEAELELFLSLFPNCFSTQEA